MTQLKAKSHFAYSERVVEQARSLKCFVEVNAMVQVMKLPSKLGTLYWFPKLYVLSSTNNKLMLWHNQAIYIAQIAWLIQAGELLPKYILFCPSPNCLYYLVCITLVVSWMAGWYGFFANNGEKRNCSNKGNKLLESVSIIYKIKRPIARANPGTRNHSRTNLKNHFRAHTRTQSRNQPRAHIWVHHLTHSKLWNHSFGPTP